MILALGTSRWKIVSLALGLFFVSTGADAIDVPSSDADNSSRRLSGYGDVDYPDDRNPGFEDVTAHDVHEVVCLDDQGARNTRDRGCTFEKPFCDQDAQECYACQPAPSTDEGCTVEKPICGNLVVKPDGNAFGTECFKCQDTSTTASGEADEGCPDGYGTCVAVGPDGNGNFGNECAICINDKANIIGDQNLDDDVDIGCSAQFPVCVGHYWAGGKHCAKCVNEQPDPSLQDPGCPPELPSCNADLGTAGVECIAAPDAPVPDLCDGTCEEGQVCIAGICSDPFSISWETTVANTNPGFGWVITNDGQTIRFDVEDSVNCDGTSSATQSGTATATIVAPVDYEFTPEIIGLGELELSSFELLTVTLDGDVIVDASAAGGGLGCEMGPVVTDFLVAAPYSLTSGQHTFELQFTTADGLYHVGAFYELNLIFVEV